MAFVQKAVSADPAAGATTRSVTISAGGTGNHIIGNISWQASTNELLNVKDNNGVTYTIQDTVLDATNATACASFFKENISGAPTSIIATFATSQLSRIGVVEWSGLAASASLDAHNGSTQTAVGTALTLGSITTTAAGDLLFGFASCDSAGSTTLVAANASDGTVCTLRNAGTGNENHYDETGVQAAAGAVQIKFTANASGQAYVTTTMAFKAAATGAGPDTKRQSRILAPNFRGPQRGLQAVQAFPPVVINATSTPLRRVFIPSRGPQRGLAPLRAFPAVTSITVLPGFGNLILTGPAPSLATRVFPGFGSVVLAGQAPALRTAIHPGFGSIVLTGPAPHLAFVDQPGFGAVVLTGFAPTVSITSGATALPGVGQITLTGFAPALATKIFPGFGAILLTGRNPSLRTAVAAGFGTVHLTGFAPIARPLPGVGLVHLTGFAPTVTTSPSGGTVFQHITSLAGFFNPGAGAIP